MTRIKSGVSAPLPTDQTLKSTNTKADAAVDKPTDVFETSPAAKMARSLVDSDPMVPGSGRVPSLPATDVL